MDAEHEARNQRVEQEDGEQGEDREHEREVGQAFAPRGAGGGGRQCRHRSDAHLTGRTLRHEDDISGGVVQWDHRSEEDAVEPSRPLINDAWTRPRSRREVLRLGAAVAIGGVVAPLLAACAPGQGSPASSASSAPGAPSPAGSSALSGPITILVGGGNPTAEPALKQVFDEFRALHPGIEWDIRSLPGGGPEWDRLARASIASGEPVGLVVINGQQVRGWVRDGLLATWRGPGDRRPCSSASRRSSTSPGPAKTRCVPFPSR